MAGVIPLENRKMLSSSSKPEKLLVLMILFLLFFCTPDATSPIRLETGFISIFIYVFSMRINVKNLYMVLHLHTNEFNGTCANTFRSKHYLAHIFHEKKHATHIQTRKFSTKRNGKLFTVLKFYFFSLRKFPGTSSLM